MNDLFIILKVNVTHFTVKYLNKYVNTYYVDSC